MAVEKRQPKRSNVEDIDLNDPEVEPLAPGGGATPSTHKKNSAIGDIVTKLVCAVFLVSAGFGLHEVRFWDVLLYASHANRPMINLGIFFCSVVVLLGSYLEYYRAIYLGEKLEYKKAASTTHGILAAMCLAGVRYIPFLNVTYLH